MPRSSDWKLWLCVLPVPGPLARRLQSMRLAPCARGSAATAAGSPTSTISPATASTLGAPRAPSSVIARSAVTRTCMARTLSFPRASLRRVAGDKRDPIYVFHSEHPILIERAVSELRDEVVPPAARGFNYDVVEGKPKASQIVALAQTLPMMAASRMVFVRDLSLLPADEGETLLDYLGKPNPSTVIVALASKLDKRLKLFAQLSKKGFLHVLDAPRQLAGWVQRLGDAVGSDLSRRALTIEQLGLYTAGKPVTSDDVDELVADTRERSVFELTDEIGAAAQARALAEVAAEGLQQ